MTRKLVPVLLIAGLMSCRAPVPHNGPAPQHLSEFPLEIYQPAAGRVVYRINAAQSRADILVRRGGSLARFGHDHAVSATTIAGYVLYVADDFRQSQADLRISLDSLIVDDPAVREGLALDTRPTPEDIRKTTENMRRKVLQTNLWPQTHLKIEITGGTPDTPTAQVTLYLHGVAHAFPITFKLEGRGTERLRATGSFHLQQSDYGIKPFSILGGALRVLDPVDVTFNLLADRVDHTGPTQASDQAFFKEDLRRPHVPHKVPRSSRPFSSG